ncbi:hypothetical protein K227x_27980 [Rubripirellula lacrimiformis]|uniref:Uncharacterized protein n=1 Tax=Rubripirellula lacrimiformis TaxID=1930273 RepID=A0A517NB89_9BACT|nr:hypothetical protein K227x_27980 [Rubripirellula lacrimiformis]
MDLMDWFWRQRMQAVAACVQRMAWVPEIRRGNLAVDLPVDLPVDLAVDLAVDLPVRLRWTFDFKEIGTKVPDVRR